MAVIYADVLVALNTVLTYIFICATRRFTRLPTKKYGVLFASVVGGASSLIIFADSLNIAVSVLYKIAVAVAITAIAFLPKTAKGFLKAFASFFAVSFLFAGLMLAIELMFSPPNMRYENGTVYFDMSVTFLAGCVLSFYGMLTLFDKILGARIHKNTLCNVRVTFRDSAVELRGLRDTGNTATDALNGKPVCFAELSKIAPLFSASELKYLKRNDYGEEVPDSLKTALHPVACSSVGGDRLLQAFVPEKIEISTSGELKKAALCTFAIVPDNLSDGEYSVILNANCE